MLGMSIRLQNCILTKIFQTQLPKIEFSEKLVMVC